MMAMDIGITSLFCKKCWCPSADITVCSGKVKNGISMAIQARSAKKLNSASEARQH